MNRTLYQRIFAAGVLLTASLVAHGQAYSGSARPPIEAAFTWGAMHANVVPGQSFWMQGGTAQLHLPLRHGLGVVGSGSLFHTAQMASTGVGLDLYTLTFGPRFTFTPVRRRLGIYGQCLVGEAWGRNSYFPTSTGVYNADSGLALETGGGVTWRVKPHLGLRLAEGGWVRTELGNATTGRQHSLRLGAGLTYQF